MSVWLSHAALIPIYWNRACPVRLPLPIIPGVNATAHRFGGFGLTNGKGTARFDITAEADELVRIEAANLNITPTQCVFLLG